jgi:hypothetical protein
VIDCGHTVPEAKSVIFECHATVEPYPHNEKLEDHQKPRDTREQLMIDPDGGIVEGPGVVWPEATNEFCSKESDWRTRATQPGIMLLFKDIRVCTILNVSETAYTFNWTMDRLYRRVENGQPIEEPLRVQGWGEGKLNRMTGQFHAETRGWDYKGRTGKDEDGRQIDLDVWDMTCVPAQRKF